MQLPVAPGDPFAILTLIVAPAILTNAASLLSLSTSNRLARATDRARELSAKLMGAEASGDPLTPVRLRQLERVQRRSVLLLGALRRFYLALSFFAATAIVSLLGAAVERLLDVGTPLLLQALLWIVAGAGAVAVGSIIWGCALLLAETRLAVRNIEDEAATVNAEYARLRQVP